jgi:hypothetical protein
MQLRFRRRCFEFSETIAEKEFPCDEAGVIEKAGDMGFELVTIKTEQREGSTTDVTYVLRRPKR